MGPVVEVNVHAVEEDECLTCSENDGYERTGEAAPYEKNECPKSRRACGHHCNCSWVHDCCHWCGAEIGEEGAVTYPNGRL